MRTSPEPFTQAWMTEGSVLPPCASAAGTPMTAPRATVTSVKSIRSRKLRRRVRVSGVGVNSRSSTSAPLLQSAPGGRLKSAPFFVYMRAGTKTWNAKPGEIERRWFVVDAEGKTLGRLATHIADTLRGKNKPQFTPHVDTGDFVIVVNAEKIAVTGKKLDDKIYYRHSGYPGGLKSRTLREQLDRRPTEVLRKAVKGMLPRNRLGRAQIGKLKIYAGPQHPHEAQAPLPLDVEGS